MRYGHRCSFACDILIKSIYCSKYVGKWLRPSEYEPRLDQRQICGYDAAQPNTESDVHIAQASSGYAILFIHGTCLVFSMD